MKPYYERDGQVIYNADCIEVLKTFPENSVDSIDLIYGYDRIYLWINIFAQLVKKSFLKRFIGNAKQFIAVKNVPIRAEV